MELDEAGRGEAAIRIHDDGVRRMARAIAGNAQDGDDLAQDAYLVWLQNPPRSGRTTRSWWRSVLRNLTSGAATKRRRRELLAEGRAPATIARPADEIAMEREISAAIREAVLGLEEPYRTTVLLRYFEDVGAAEIARRQKVPAATVRTRLRRGLDHVGRELSIRLGNGWRGALLILLRGPVRGEPAPGPSPVAVRKPRPAAMPAAAAAVLIVAVAGWKVFLAGGSDGAEMAGGTAPQDGGLSTVAMEASAPEPIKASAFVARNGSITGRVLDPSGAPVAGARVIVASHLVAGVVPARGELPPRASGVLTGAEGGFELRPVAEDRFHLLAVDAEGFKPWVRDVVETGAAVDAVLENGGAVEGTVRDPAGNAAPGAAVRWTAVVSGVLFERSCHPDAVGRFAMQGATSEVPGAWARGAEFLEFEAPGFAPRRIVLPAPGGASGARSFDLRLREGSRVRGSVVAEFGGRSIAGASVLLWSHVRADPVPGPYGRWVADPRLPWVLGRTQTAEGGGFSFEHVPAADPGGDPAVEGGIVWAGAWAESFAAAQRALAIPKDGCAVETRLACFDRGEMKVRVHHDDGSPAPGIAVRLAMGASEEDATPPGWPAPGAGGLTDGEGTCTFPHMLNLRAGLKGDFRLSNPRILFEGAPYRDLRFRVRDEGAILQDLKLPQLSPLNLRVTDEQGRPIRGAVLSVRGRSWPPTDPMPSQVSGADGRVTFMSERGATVRKFEVRAPGFSPGESRPVPASEEPPPVVVVTLRQGPPDLPASPATNTPPEGRADSQRTGATIAGSVELETTAILKERIEAYLSRGREVLSGEDMGFTAFRFRGVAPGRWTLQVTSRGLEAIVRPVDVPEGASFIPLALTAMRGRALRGRIRRSGGGEFGDPTVYFVDPSGTGVSFTAPLDGEGRFEANGLPRGRPLLFLVRDRAPRGAEAFRCPALPGDLVTFDDALYEQGFDQEVVPTALIRISVLPPAALALTAGPETRDAADPSIELLTENGTVAWSYQGELPSQRFVPVPEGRYVMVLRGNGREIRRELHATTLKLCKATIDFP